MNENSSDPDRHPIDVIAEEFALSCRNGERPSISDYAERHPEIADEIRRLLPSVAMMERMNAARRSQPQPAVSPALQRIGDFRIVRELGRGGMGVVFEAMQESLGRRVAVKVLSATATLDPTRLARFEQEARAAAGLHHTNIVPIFGVGQQDDIHYIVMQCIDGQGLGQVTRTLASARTRTSGRSLPRMSGSSPVDRDLPLSPTPAGQTVATLPADRSPADHCNWVASVGVQVAGALQYAHDRGVLHRDVKPANLILDERGVVWIADFGLAKVADNSNVTRTGDIVGTLQYMAPEAINKQVDVRSDIYGLGLTLYELLLLRPPFQDASPAELIRLISTTSPPAPRSIDASIPRDLETIILKSIAREPAQRYATAAQMGRDLEAFLRGRPISARRVPAWERAWRWSRRNRAVAALMVATTVSLLAAMVVGWIGYTSTSTALRAESARRTEAEDARKAADAARINADQNLRLCLESLADLFTQVGDNSALSGTGMIDDPGRGPPGRGPERGGPDRMPVKDIRAMVNAGVLEGVLRFYDRFAAENLTDPALEVEAAWGYLRVADVYRMLGDTDAADRSYVRSAESFRRLLGGGLAAGPLASRALAGLVEATGSVSSIPADQAARAQAIDQLRVAMDRYGRSEPVDAESARRIAACQYRLGRLLAESNEPAAAEQAYHAALTSLRNDVERERDRRPGDGQPGDRGRAGPPVVTPIEPTVQLAKLLTAEGRPEDARGLLTETIEQLDAVRRGRPERVGGRPPLNLVPLWETLAEVETTLGNPSGAAAARQSAARARDRGNRPGPPPPRGPGEGPPGCE